MQLICRSYLSLGLGRLKLPQPKRSTLELGRKSVFLHSCFGHRAVVVEGYFVNRLPLSISLSRWLLYGCWQQVLNEWIISDSVAEGTLAYLPLGQLQHGPSGHKSVSFWGLRAPSPHQSFAHGPHWHTGETPKVPIPQFPLSGNERFSLSLRLCISNGVSWRHGFVAGWVDNTDKSFGFDLPLLFKVDEIFSWKLLKL